MRYMLMIYSDGVPTSEKAAANAAGIPRLLERLGDSRVFGHRLAPAGEAVTVRTRGGEVLRGDGPFAESKEYLAGFDIIDAADLDAAIEIAAAHPVAGFHAIEIRPFMEDEHGVAPEGCGDSGLPEDWDPAGPAVGRHRYLLIMCADGRRASDAEEEAMRMAGVRWGESLDAVRSGGFGHALLGADTATTVRVRDGETILTDGPFIEAKEHLAGYYVVDVPDHAAAVAVAAEIPDAKYVAVEVRPLRPGPPERR
jgi:hypothetical protein